MTYVYARNVGITKQVAIDSGLEEGLSLTPGERNAFMAIRTSTRMAIAENVPVFGRPNTAPRVKLRWSWPVRWKAPALSALTR